MVLTIELEPRTEARLRQQAKAAGKDVNSYVSKLVEQAAAKSSMDEILAPIRQQFAASGRSDEQLIADITEAQAEYRAERRGRR